MFEVQLEKLLVLPMFILVLFTILNLLYIVIARTRAVLKKEIPENFFVAKIKTENFSYPQRFTILDNHFKNLLELPPFYYFACIMVIILAEIDEVIVLSGLAFFLLRLVHSFIHLTYNKVSHRFTVFLFSLIALLSMWVKIFYNFLF